MTTDELLLEARGKIKDGTIVRASKQELEQYAIALSTSDARDRFPAAQFAQACELVRLLLSVRISEENNKEATKISKIALIVAIVALIATVIQTIVSAWPLCHPKGQGISQVATPQQATQTAKQK